ncbi:MAG: hypothetical protein IKO27_08830 [Ruminococcus sp.]|nr:hypothetical protein [Ruminococcus sp.]
MIVLIDDIKLRNDEEFFAYIDSIFSGVKIGSLDELAQYLLSTDETIELLVSDYEQIEDKSFASKVMKVFIDARDARDNIKLTQM